MALWRKVLCPVDFSEASRTALREATRIARWFAVPLLIVHVAPERPSGSGVPLSPPLHGRAREGAEQSMLDAWTKDVQASVPTATSLELTGRASDEIVRSVTEFGCDLVVMGTHGRTGFTRVALGSVADAVIRKSPCPVLVVRAAAES